MQNLYYESNKAVLEEIKEDLNKWKDIPCSWIGRLTAKMAIFPQIDI